MSISRSPMASPVLPAPGMTLARPRLPAQDQAASITPADIWRIIKKRMLLIIITIAVTLTVGIPLNVLWYYYWPKWSAFALLQVVYPVVPEAYTERRATYGPQLEIFQRSEAQAIQSRKYASILLADAGIRGTDWYKRDEVMALSRFERQLSVIPIRNTSVIKVAFATRNREESPKIVNDLVRIYLSDRRRLATTDLEDQVKNLRAQHLKLQNELRTLTESMKRFVETEDIPVSRNITMSTEFGAELGRLVLIRSELTMTNDATMSALENLQNQPAETWMPSPEQSYRIDNEPAIRTLKAYLLDLRERREVQSKRLGHDHLFIQRLDESILVANRDLQQKTTETRLKIYYETLQAYGNAVESNDKMLTKIQTSIDENLDKQSELNSKIMQYQGQLEEKAALVKYVGFVENRINTAEATIDQHKGGVSSQVVALSLATPAPARSSPSLKVNIPATVFLGMFIAVGLAFALELMDKSVRSSQDVRRHTELTFLGSIPALHEDEAGPVDMYSVVMQAPRSLLAEAFRQVRTNLLFYCRREDARSVLITSPSPEDGRTCIAVNLSASVALSGMKVLLIDANFCKPGLNQLFPNLPDAGFSELLLGTASADQVVVDSPVPGLFVMGNGQGLTGQADLLTTVNVREVMNKLTQQYDQVILDGPPALLAAHALAIAGQVDGTVFVARAGKNSRGELNRMREEISSLNSHIHGVILNGVEATRGGYLRKHYQQFYDYHYPEALPDLHIPAQADSQPPTPPQTG